MSIPREVLAKIRRIEIRTSRRANAMLSGTWHSAFKGRGIEFEEVRPYQVGDDVRTIDWNVTARAGEPFVKLFREERELVVWLAVDLSGSIDFGTSLSSKRDLVTELGATLAFSAIKNHDKVGLTLFTDQIEKNVPAGQGSRHVLRIIRELLYCQPIGRGTNLSTALDHLNHTAGRKSVVFMISDFQDMGFERPLRIAARKHDLIPVIINDPRELELPDVGLVRLRDAESGEVIVVDTGSRRGRALYAELVRNEHQRRDTQFKKLGTRPLVLTVGDDFVEPLQQYFHRREER